MKNLAASVHARLALRRARTGEDFNMLLIRFSMERLLYRRRQVPAQFSWIDQRLPPPGGNWMHRAQTPNSSTDVNHCC